MQVDDGIFACRVYHNQAEDIGFSPLSLGTQSLIFNIFLVTFYWSKSLYQGITKFGSGALSGKMLLVWIVENNKFMFTLGQVRLRNG